MRLEAGGKVLDVEPDEFPRFTFALDDIEDITAVRGARSTTITVPATNANRQALGGYAMAEAGTDEMTCKVLEGTAAYFDGTANVTSRSNEEYNLSAIGSSSVWMQAMKDVNLRDLDMGATATVNEAFVENTWTDTTTPLYFPVVDYGSLELRAAGYNVPFTKVRPGIRVLNFLRRAFLDAGFALEFTGAFNELVPKLVILNNNNTIPISDAYKAQTSATFAADGTQILNTTVPTYEDVLFPSVISDPSGTYAGTGKYTAPFDLGSQPTLTVSLASTFLGGPGFLVVALQVYDYNTLSVVESKAYVMSSNNAGITDTFTFNTFQMGAGRDYGIRASCNYAGGGSVVTVITAAEITWDTQSIEWQSGLELDIAKQAPKMKALDCFKWMCNLFCLQVVTQGTAVKVGYYDEFYQPVSDGFTDLSARCDGDAVKVTDPVPSAYIFKHKEDSDDRLIADLRDRDGEYGAGDFKYSTGGNDDERDIEIGFAATAMATVFGELRVPALREVDAKLLEAPNPDAGFYPDTYDWEPRLMIADDLATGDWTFNGGARTTYPNCYSYSGSTSGLSTLFGVVSGTPGNVTRRWSNKLRRWIAPVLQVDVFWADHELMAFDPSKPVKAHDGQMAGFYYPQKVDQHRFGMGLSSETTLIPL
jgi:hypothetical protein